MQKSGFCYKFFFSIFYVANFAYNEIRPVHERVKFLQIGNWFPIYQRGLIVFYRALLVENLTRRRVAIVISNNGGSRR